MKCCVALACVLFLFPVVAAPRGPGRRPPGKRRVEVIAPVELGVRMFSPARFTPDGFRVLYVERGDGPFHEH